MTRYKSFFVKTINKHFPFASKSILGLIEEEYALIKRHSDFYKVSSNPMDKRIDVAAYFLSMFIVLEQNGKSFEEIRNMALDIASDIVKPKNKLHAWWKKAKVNLLLQPYMHWFLDKFDSKVARKGHADGFVAHLIQKKKNEDEYVFGFDILECGICKLFQKYNCVRFASILCEVDYLTSELAGLKLYRNGTIALGAKKCDFRFEKLNQP